jgi:hypothetical protein
MFDHLLVILYVADMEHSLALYRDVLGGEETYRFPREGAPEQWSFGSVPRYWR